MATVSSTIKMFDSMTQPLKSITQGMNLMVSSMQEMQKATNQNVNIDKTLAAAKGQISAAEVEIMRAIEESTGAQERFNRSIQQSEGRTRRLLSTVKGIAAAYLSFQAAKEVFTSGLGGAMDQQQMIDTFTSRAGNDALGREIYNQITQQALKYGQDVNASLAGSMSYMSNTMDPGQLVELNKIAMRLQKLNPTEGLEGAAFSLKELMSGDYTSIAERFNISRSALKDSGARTAGMNGDIDGFIKGMDDLLNAQNMTQEAFEKMLDSPAAKWQGVLETFKFNMASTGHQALQALTPVFDTINMAFASGKAEAFFDAIGNGLKWTATLAKGVFDALYQTYDFFAQNRDVIEPIIWGIVAAMGAWVIASQREALWQGILAARAGITTAATTAQTVATFAQTAATLGLAAAWNMLNATMKANVIIFIISLIIGLIAWVYKAWQANDAFAAGMMRVWNSILNFFDQVPIFFAKVGMGIVNAFQNAKTFSLNILESLINGVIDGINWLIEKVNSITGLEIEVIEKVNFAAEQAVQAEAIRQAGEQAIKWMEAEAALNAAAREQKVIDMLNKRALNRAQEEDPFFPPAAGGMYSAGGEIDRIGQIDEVGKINSTVDISSEDLKIMREIAEMKSIQNFVSLAPSISVTTGPVHKDADIDSIISKIEEKLENEIVASVNGIYN